VNEALIGLVGVIVGALLGGTGKYWLLRRDAWREARTSGLLTLADVRAASARSDPARLAAHLETLLRTWGTQREVLAGFRQGNFPNGFRAPEWLELAAHMGRLQDVADTQSGSIDATAAHRELEAAETLLSRFEADPPVVGYVIGATFRR
jgi:hypothetical protein